MKTLKFIIFFFIVFSFNVKGLSDNTNENKDIFNLSLNDLMNVKVKTASKTEEEVKDIPASVIVITRKDIKKYGFINLSDLIQNIAGFYKINDYYWLGSDNFGVRGFFSPGVLNDFIILVNNVKLKGDAYSDYSLSKINIPIEAIDRIEIVRGPLSVIYGTGAFLGAINIITNKPEKSFASSSIGTNNYYKFFLRTSKRSKDFQFSINASLIGDNGINKKLSELTDNHNFLKNVGLDKDTSIRGMLKQSNKYFNFFGKYKNLTFDMNYSLVRKGVFDGLPSFPPGTFFNNKFTSIKLEYEKRISSKLKIDSKITHISDTFYWEYNLLKENSYSTNYINTLSNDIEINLIYKPVDKLNFLTGFTRHNVYYLYKTYDYPIFREKYENTEIKSDNDIISDSLFTQMNYSPNKYLRIVLGFRLEKTHKYNFSILNAPDTNLSNSVTGNFTDDDIKFIPRVALIYKPKKSQSIKLLYGKGIKQPSIMQNITQIYSGYNQLFPAYMETLEINYLLSIKRNLFLNLSLYKNNIDNLIVKRNIYDSTSKTWKLYSTNSGKMETKGIEMGIKYKPIENLNMDFNLSYQKTKNLEKGFENIIPGYAPELLGYFKIDLKLRNSYFALIGRYVSEMESMWEINPNKEIDKGKRIGVTIAPQSCLDFNFRIENLLSKKLFVNLHIYNIFDNEIRFPTTPGNSWANLGTIDYGRFFILSIGTYFK